MIYIIPIILRFISNQLYFKQDWLSVIMLIIAITLGVRYGNKNKN